MFDPKKVIELQNQVREYKNSAKFRVETEYVFNKKCDTDLLYDHMEDNIHLEYDWQDNIVLYSDDLISILRVVYARIRIPIFINNIDVNNIDFDFITVKRNKLENHPEKDKIISLIESLDKTNIELAEMLLINT